uniref:Hydroxyacylglutathione hydrolase C-terminal domain-containing protein n=1 Tax=Strigamia maritima TaxID=126957 RepID=T1J5N2_STRMM
MCIDYALFTVLNDHAGGNRAAASRFPKIPIYGGDDRVQNVTKLVSRGEVLHFGPLTVKCLLDPEESSGHVIYVVKNELDKKCEHAFVGDAFSIAGFGNFPESHKKHVYKILTQDIGKLSDNTEIYCGQESAIRNLNIAKTIEPTNPLIQKKLAWALGQRDKNDPTVPSYFYEEKKYNPFLRLSVPEVQRYFGTNSAQD